MADLLELAARCEAAEGPDGESDMLIWAALNGVTGITYPTEGHPMTPGRGGRVEGTDADGEWCLLGWIDPGEKQRNWSPYGGNNRYPHYTASLDAAMQLVPEGHHWQVGIGIETEAGNRDHAYAWCSESDNGELAIAVTPALALCAAALRARSVNTPQDQEAGL